MVFKLSLWQDFTLSGSPLCPPLHEPVKCETVIQMAITIENPTAEAAFEALQQLPQEEFARLKHMFAEANYGEGYQDFWTYEDMKDAARSTALLIEKRFGPEEADYD